MGGICFNGGSDCRTSNAATQYGNPKLGGWGLVPLPFPQWPPKHQTAATLAGSSTVSRISSGLPRSSDGALTSTASLKTLQSPSAAVPSSNSALKTFSAPRVPASVTNAFPSSTKLSTATLISSFSNPSNSISNSYPAPTNSPTTILVSVSSGTSNTPTLTQSISAKPLPSSDPPLPSTLSNIVLMTLTGLTSVASSTSIAAEAASQQTQAIGIGVTEMPKSGKMDMVVGIVIGIILGVILLILPLTFYIYRRRTRKQAHRRSIGAIEKDKMFRPWKKSEMNLRRRTANMASLYYPSDKVPGEVAMPQPVFAPLRPNRSSSLYSGSILNGLEHLSTEEDIHKPRSPETSRKSFDRESVQSLPLSGTSTSSRYSGYVYSDDPFEAPLIAPEMRRPDSVATEWNPPRDYKGRIRFGMGVQKTMTREK